MLNSASTIFTMDIFKRYLKPEAPQQTLVYVGRGTTLFFVVIGCLIAPFLGHERFGGVFNYIQEFQGYISPGILAAFVFGFIVKRAPEIAGAAALLISAPVYGLLQWQFNSIAYLNRMAITFFIVLAFMGLLTVLFPNPSPKALPEQVQIDTRRDPLVMMAGGAVLIVIAIFYAVFW